MNIKVSDWLLEKVCKGEAILFLGAGASIGARDSQGGESPNGEQLRDKISDRFLNGNKKKWPLARVADYAKNIYTLNEVQEYIGELLEPLNPASFHSIIPLFRWHAIFTTNYDQIVERAYNNCPERIQKLSPIIRDDDNFSRIISSPNTVPFLKIHGCITVLNDPNLPLILASEEYAKYEKGRRRLFSHLRDWGYDHPIIFCGYDVNDPNIEHILFDLCDLGLRRPQFVLVNPALDEIDKQVWNGRRFETIKADFETFLNYLVDNIPPSKRILSAFINNNGLSVSRWFKTHLTPSNDLAAYLSDELTHIYSGMPLSGVEPKHFYQGQDNSWGVIEQQLDVRRRVTDDIVTDVALSDSKNKPVRCVVLKGYAGSGKTITLKRCAWEAVHDFDSLVLYLKIGSILRVSLITEFYRLVRTPITIFIADAISNLQEIINLLDIAKREKIEITIVCGVRTNEWNVYGANLSRYVDQEYELRDLSEKEIRTLIDKLEKHQCLGELEKLSAVDRQKAFIFSAERQLLVALHEAKSGKPFEEIVLDEYRRIVPPEAQMLYLDICTLHQYRAPVRAGLISRISGITFAEFRDKLLRPLEHVVLVEKDGLSRDYVYKSRHPLIARFVFEQVLISPENRSEQIVRIIRHMNVDYRWDQEAFEYLIKGRKLANFFADRTLSDAIYKAAYETGASRSYIKHQEAVFELSHRGGSMKRALNAIQDAEECTTRGVSAILHTKATVFRRLAIETEHPLEKQKLRQKAKDILSKELIRAEDSFWHVGLVQLLLDDLKERAAIGFKDEDILENRVTTSLITEADKTISTAIQLFPDDEHVLSIEAELSEFLDDQPRAIKALESAFIINPRNETVAVRLAEHYLRTLRIDDSIDILKKCINENPDAKTVRLKLARIYIDTDESHNAETIAYHLKRSFTEGDTNFLAQLFYARHQFLYGKKDESERIFNWLKAQKFPPKLRSRRFGIVKNGMESFKEYTGNITTINTNYCFIKIHDFNYDLFCYFTDFRIEDWDHLTRDMPIQCNLAFTLRGPCAVNARILPERL